jgi:hypothetical protein
VLRLHWIVDPAALTVAHRPLEERPSLSRPLMCANPALLCLFLFVHKHKRYSVLVYRSEEETVAVK